MKKTVFLVACPCCAGLLGLFVFLLASGGNIAGALPAVLACALLPAGIVLAALLLFYRKKKAEELLRSDCPACGARFDADAAGRCKYCGEQLVKPTAKRR